MKYANIYNYILYKQQPKTNLKDEYESLKKQRDEEIEWEKRMASKREKGRAEYLNQLKQLSTSQGGGSSSDGDIETNGQRRGWFRGLRRSDNGNEKSSSPSI